MNTQDKAQGFDSLQLRNLSQVIHERRATFHFAPDAVDPDHLNLILHLAGQAPSGYNLQPWRFVVVRDEEARRRLQKVAYNQEKVSEAPVVVIFLGMKEEVKRAAEEIFYAGVKRGVGHVETVKKNLDQALGFIASQGMDHWVTKHTMIAFTTMMLAAEAFGYDTAPMEGFDPAGVRKEFGIPDEAEVVALLAIGKAKLPDKPYPGRLPLERIAFSERFGQPWKKPAPPSPPLTGKGGVGDPALAEHPGNSARSGGSQQSTVKCCGEM